MKKKIPSFANKLQDILPWIVRVEVQHDTSNDGYTSNYDTGIILKGGKVITAKHVITKNVRDLKAKTTADATGEVLYYTINTIPAKDIQPNEQHHLTAPQTNKTSYSYNLM